MFLLDWALTFLVLALITGILGFSGIAQESAYIARILFLIFLIIYIISFISLGHHRTLYIRFFDDDTTHRD